MKTKNDNWKWWYGQFADENGTIVHSTRIYAKTKKDAIASLKKISTRGHKFVGVEEF